MGVVDTFPVGFKYVAGSSRVDGQPVEPVITNRQLSWNGLQLGTDREPYEVRVRLAVRCVDRAQAEAVGQEVEALYLNGPAGGGGVTQSVREVIAAASTLVPRSAVRPRCDILELHAED